MTNIFVIGAIISILGVLFIFLLKDYRKLTNKILIIFFTISSVRYCIDLLNEFYSIELILRFAGTIGHSFLILVFLYIKYITSDHKQFQKLDLLYFLPIILILASIVIAGDDYSPVYTESNRLRVTIIHFLFVFYKLFFTIISIRILLIHRAKLKNFYSTESASILLGWIWGIIIYYSITFLSAPLIHILNEKHALLSITPIAFSKTNETILIVVMLVFGIWQKELLSTTSQTKDKYSRSGLNSDRILQIKAKLEEHMSSKKPYLESSLSIEELAHQLNEKRHNLTEVINTSYDKNFFNFVKEYRINHVIELMSQESHKNIKIIYLAFDSGFNNKTSFNKAFKEVTGKTPSEYLKKNKMK